MKEPVKIKERPSSERGSNFDEVVLGYSEAEALEEAKRCLQCKNPLCSQGCPVGIDIKKFIKEITEKDYKSAYLTIKETNNFPSICGRVCPAEYQCRKACVLTKKGSVFASDNAINIHFLERFAGDFGKDEQVVNPSKPRAALSGKRVAVVGSGPASLCCAGELARNGVEVTIFEGLHKTGGVLRYGIPPFRLPRNMLDFEIDHLKKIGVKIVTSFIIGKAKTLDEIFAEGYSAIFLGLGAGIPSFLGVEGENLCNIYSANEFLTRVNLMEAYKYPQFHTPVNIGKSMVVIGGGNTAMDAARVALRLQKMAGLEPDTTVIYRRTEVEMPARRLEIHHAKEEGVKFEFLVQPVSFGGDKDGCVSALKVLKCELGEPDPSGRRRPVPVKGSETDIECDGVVIALGLQANTLLTNVVPGLKVDKYKDIVVDPETMATSLEGVYAGGDIVGGEGTVIEAMGMGKKAARAIIDHIA
ncbi:MAG: NADPH-dependent glutamate synthase [Candidatus Omnitrophota bacterium]